MLRMRMVVIQLPRTIPTTMARLIITGKKMISSFSLYLHCFLLLRSFKGISSNFFNMDQLYLCTFQQFESVGYPVFFLVNHPDDSSLDNQLGTLYAG